MQVNNTLQEICKASTMKAAMAMSKFLKTPLKFNMKPITIEPLQKLDLPHYNESVVGLFVPIDSHIKGGSLLLSTTKAALATCDLMFSRTEGHTNKITEIEESALKELANIVLGNFLSNFAHSLLTSSLMHSPATYENNTSMAITAHIRSLLSDKVGDDQVINIAFTYEHSNIKGNINIVLDAKKINYLLNEITMLTHG